MIIVIYVFRLYEYYMNINSKKMSNKRWNFVQFFHDFYIFI